jgi:hypothetical protein
VTSNDRSDWLDLERGLPTEEKDVAALRALRYPRMTDDAYLRFLAALGPSASAVLADKRGPRGRRFTLR